MNTKVNGNDMAPQDDPKVEIVGSGFAVGDAGNDEIAELLGSEVCRIGDKTYCAQGGYLIMERPDYCGDAAACIELLEWRDVTVFIRPTVKHRKARAFKQEHVAIFEFQDTLYMTRPQLTEDAAAACALWFVLGKSRVT